MLSLIVEGAYEKVSKFNEVSLQQNTFKQNFFCKNKGNNNNILIITLIKLFNTFFSKKNIEN